jgi:hypothetical protein
MAFCYPYLAADPLLDGLRGQPEFATSLMVARERYESFRAEFF